MQSTDIDVDMLELDPENPRLPESMVGCAETDNLKWLNDEAVLNELAASMVENGFFRHEPLIVLQPTRPGEKYIVLEGNRRFAALTILLQLPAAQDAGLQFDFQVPPSAEQFERLRKVPCFVVGSRDEVRKFLGFRHIGGVRTWSPEAKARYLDEEVRRAIASGSHNAFRDVARLVGSNAAGVRGPYIALHILRAGRDLFGLEVTHVLQHRFGVWNRMMNSRDLREYIGFREATTVEDVQRSLEHLAPSRLAEVLGDLTPADGQRTAVLNDSRDVTAYAAVLQDERARSTLRTYQDLGLAKQIVERANLGQKIMNLVRSVDLLMRDIDESDVNADVLDASNALSSRVKTLTAGIKARMEPDSDD